MKKSTIIGMTVGGLLVVGGSVLAYLKREAIKELAGQVVEEAKKLLNEKKSTTDATQTEE